jgi:hypothetical protein
VCRRIASAKSCARRLSEVISTSMLFLMNLRGGAGWGAVIEAVMGASWGEGPAAGVMQLRAAAEQQACDLRGRAAACSARACGCSRHQCAVCGQLSCCSIAPAV